MPSSDARWSTIADHSASLVPGITPDPGAQWERLVARLRSLEGRLWWAAGTLLVLDLLTTAYGLRLGLVEANPIAASLLESHGLWALAVLKGLAFAVAVSGWAVLTRDCRAVVPVCLAAPWFAGTASNALLIASVVVQ